VTPNAALFKANKDWILEEMLPLEKYNVDPIEGHPDLVDAIRIKGENGERFIGGRNVVERDDFIQQYRTAQKLAIAAGEPAIKEGFAHKEGAIRKNWKERYFTLTRTKIVYTDGSMESSRVLKGTIALGVVNNAQISGRRGVPFENCFEIVTEQRTFFICVETEQEMKSWIDQINSIKLQYDEIYKKPSQ